MGIRRIQFDMPTQPLVRILVIDDEPLGRLDAREILEDAGYVVTEAASAECRNAFAQRGGNGRSHPH